MAMLLYNKLHDITLKIELHGNSCMFEAVWQVAWWCWYNNTQNVYTIAWEHVQLHDKALWHLVCQGILLYLCSYIAIQYST